VALWRVNDPLILGRKSSRGVEQKATPSTIMRAPFKPPACHLAKSAGRAQASLFEAKPIPNDQRLTASACCGACRSGWVPDVITDGSKEQRGTRLA